MRCKVYRALDRKNSFLGLRGAYFVYTVYGIAAAAVPSVVIGAATSSTIGTIVFALLAVAVYVAVKRVQSSFTERELRRFLASLRLSYTIRLRPERIKTVIRRTGQRSEK